MTSALWGQVHSTTSTTETSTTDSTRITNEMDTSSDYLMKYFNGFGRLTRITDDLSTTKKSVILVVVLISLLD